MAASVRAYALDNGIDSINIVHKNWQSTHHTGKFFRSFLRSLPEAIIGRHFYAVLYPPSVTIGNSQLSDRSSWEKMSPSDVGAVIVCLAHGNDVINPDLYFNDRPVRK